MKFLPSAVYLALASSFSSPLYASAKRPAIKPGPTSGGPTPPGQAKKINTDEVGNLDFTSDDALEIDVQLEEDGLTRTFRRQERRGQGGGPGSPGPDSLLAVSDDGAVLNMIKAPNGNANANANANAGGGASSGGGGSGIYASIHGADDAVYSLELDAEGQAVVRKTMTEDFPPEGEPQDGYLKGEEEEESTRRARGLLRRGGDSTSHAFSSLMSMSKARNLQGNEGDDTGAFTDVLVMWTNKAECANSNLAQGCTHTAQTTNNMHSRIRQAIVETNVAYELSGVTTRLRLVGSYRDPSGYVETGFSPALSALRSTNDGNMDGVHGMRTALGADVVALIIADPAYCGMAYLGPSTTSMFSVTAYNCATGYFSFGHEIGHNQGCNHDRGTTNACSNSNYNYGWREPSGAYRTILAYSCRTGQCDNNAKSGCNRIQRFSNTNTSPYTWGDGPIGGANDNNAGRINDVSGTVAAYYTALADPCAREGGCPTGLVCMTATEGNSYCGTPSSTDECTAENAAVNCNDNVACTTDTCVSGTCVNSPSHTSCSDGVYCNGAEVCNPLDPTADLDGCIAGTPVNCDDGNACTTDACNEGLDKCDNTGITCPDDGFYCTGPPTCDSIQGCGFGPGPCTAPGLEACDENAGQCVECTAPATGCSVNQVCKVDTANSANNMCVDCVSNGDCSSGACDTIVNECVPCLEDTDCSATSQVCKLGASNDLNQCVDCLNSFQHCTTPGLEVCDTDAHQCVACTDTAGCAVEQVCKVDTNIANNMCVECLNKTHCTADPSLPVCDAGTNTCVECTANSDCSAPEPACDATTNTCVQCTADANCPTGQVCDTGANQCVQCNVGTDCDPGTFCAPAVCSANVCTTGSDPCTPSGQKCNTALGQCVDCLVDTDCPDDGLYCTGAPTCDASTGSCGTSGSPCTAPDQSCLNSGDGRCCLNTKAACTGNSDCCSNKCRGGGSNKECKS